MWGPQCRLLSTLPCAMPVLPGAAGHAAGCCMSPPITWTSVPRRRWRRQSAPLRVSGGGSRQDGTMRGTGVSCTGALHTLMLSNAWHRHGLHWCLAHVIAATSTDCRWAHTPCTSWWPSRQRSSSAAAAVQLASRLGTVSTAWAAQTAAAGQSAEVWGPQLAARAASGNGSSGCAAELLHLSFLHHMLGVRQGPPNAVVLAETGERPLWAGWLLRAARPWHRELAPPPDSLLRQVVLTSAALAAEPGSALKPYIT